VVAKKLSYPQQRALRAAKEGRLYREEARDSGAYRAVGWPGVFTRPTIAALVSRGLLSESRVSYRPLVITDAGLEALKESRRDA
jgi:hypothetical protein